MTDPYTFHKVHKAEDNLGYIIDEMVHDQVLQWFGVEDVLDLTQEQIDEIDEFRTNILSEYSPLQWGYSSLINLWESQDWEGAPLS